MLLYLIIIICSLSSGMSLIRKQKTQAETSACVIFHSPLHKGEAKDKPTESRLYFILSTHVNNRLHRIPLNPFLSGSLDHHTNSGLPTIWSSGTKPQ